MSSLRLATSVIPALAMSIALLSGCGMGDVPNKMDDTNDGVDEMNGKMDQTNADLGTMNEKVDETNGKLDETNAGLDETNSSLDETNASLDQTNASIDETNTGLDQTNASLDQTNASLDQTNAGLDSVNDQLGDTNAGLDALSDQVGATNGSLLTLLDEIKATNAGIDQLNDQIAVTTAGVHSQILLLSLSEMTKPENTLVLFPPVGMMPAGKQFAAEATGQEVLELTHAWISEIEHANLDADTLRASGYSEEEIARQLAQLQHTKEMKLAGLQIICGFLPQARVQEIALHIAQHGRYRRAGLSALMLRSVFISMFLLDGGLFTERLSTHGQMIEAIEHVAELDYLGRLPFVGEIAFETTLTGRLAFEPRPLLVRLYSELDHRFDTDLDPVYQTAHPTDPILAQQIADLTSLRTKVQSDKAYWSAP